MDYIKYIINILQTIWYLPGRLAFTLDHPTHRDEKLEFWRNWNAIKMSPKNICVEFGILVEPVNNYFRSIKSLPFDRSMPPENDLAGFINCFSST